ncbi:MFS transporter [Actinomadura sp. DC4]|uniref:MFS transporter n=1 Tax=Actinomadura sp. DC4 TaxID=3055069 RepID=UPI0025B0384E|nr:MFS transporter [Actinomadura sp. DC4]MDN3356440.1 MFS transporter [Actinomadura sp. DC4]
MDHGDGTDRPRSLRGLYGLLGADFAALSANRLLSIAVPWFVLTTTGSAAKTGLIAFCQITPYVISQALAGPLIDRIGPRRIAIAGDLVSMAAMVTAPLLYEAGALHLWVLMALMALTGTADGPAITAKAVFIPSVTRAARAPIERGTGLVTTIERTATVAGPTGAGFLVAMFGGAQALWLSAALFGAAALVVATTLSDPEPEPVEPSTTEVTGYFAQLRQGAAFLRGDGLLCAIAGMLVVTNLLDQAFMSVLLPSWARHAGYGAETVGLVVSVFAATSIVASLAAATFGSRLPRHAVYLVGFVIGGVPRFAALALSIPLWVVLAVFAVGGLGSGFVNPILAAVSFDRIPTRLLGRVRTLTNGLAWAGIPFGGLFAAAAIAVSGLTGAMIIVGACYLVATVVPGLRPEWSELRGTPAAPDAPASLTDQEQEKGAKNVRVA